MQSEQMRFWTGWLLHLFDSRPHDDFDLWAGSPRETIYDGHMGLNLKVHFWIPAYDSNDKQRWG